MERKTTSARFKRIIAKNRMLFVLSFLVIIVSFTSPAFLTLKNFTNVLRQISINAIIAFGMSFVITAGGIDLSVGSIVGIAGVGMGLLATSEHPIFLIVLLSLMIGALVGALNGFGIAKFRIPPFIATLAMQNVARGIAYILCDGLPIIGFREKYIIIGQGYWMGVPIPVYIMAVVAIFAAVVFNKTQFGRYVYFTGGNEQAALYSGINVFKVKVITYMICGMLAGLGGLVLSFRVASAMPTNGLGFEGDAIAAAVIGGCAMRGGYSTVHGTLIGALILGVISNGMNLLGITQYWQMIMKGFVIFIAVVLDSRLTNEKLSK